MMDLDDKIDRYYTLERKLKESPDLATLTEAFLLLVDVADNLLKVHTQNFLALDGRLRAIEDRPRDGDEWKID